LPKWARYYIYHVETFMGAEHVEEGNSNPAAIRNRVKKKFRGVRAFLGTRSRKLKTIKF